MNYSATNIPCSNNSFSVEPRAYLIYNVALGMLNAILGIPTNVCVIWLIWKKRRQKCVSSDLFALNLSVTEVLSSILNGVYCFSLTAQAPIGMEFLDLSIGLSYAGRPLFQCCICVERYLAVVHPVVYMKYKLPRYKTACSGSVWVTVMGACLTNMYLPTWRMSNIFLTFLLMFSVQLFCCLAVLRALKRPGPGEGDRQREGANNIKMRAFKIISLIFMSVLVNYLPMIATVFLEGTKTFNLSFSVSLTCAVVTGFVNPVLYIHGAGKLVCLRGM